MSNRYRSETGNSYARNPDRVIDFSDGKLAGLPPARNYMDFWYDRTQTYLFARRNPSNKAIQMGVLFSSPQHRARLAILGDKKRYHMLKAPTVDAAREHARILHEETEAALAKYKSLGAQIAPASGRPVKAAEDILVARTSDGETSYDSLMSVLMDAFQQASSGKGAERHGDGLSFEDQDMMQIMDRVGPGFAYGQAIKKICESQKMKPKMARAELLGAVVYLAGAVLWKDRSGR